VYILQSRTAVNWFFAVATIIYGIEDYVALLFPPLLQSGSDIPANSELIAISIELLLLPALDEEFRTHGVTRWSASRKLIKRRCTRENTATRELNRYNLRRNFVHQTIS